MHLNLPQMNTNQIQFIVLACVNIEMCTWCYNLALSRIIESSTILYYKRRLLPSCNEVSLLCDPQLILFCFSHIECSVLVLHLSVHFEVFPLITTSL